MSDEDQQPDPSARTRQGIGVVVAVAAVAALLLFITRPEGTGSSPDDDDSPAPAPTVQPTDYIVSLMIRQGLAPRARAAWTARRWSGCARRPSRTPRRTAGASS